MQQSCRPGIDDTFLEELLLSESSPGVVSPPFLRSPMDAIRKRGGSHGKRNKAHDYPLDAPSTVVRQALFPSGPGSYPSQVDPLRQSKQGRQQLAMHAQDEHWARKYPNEHKWREMGWNTSCPAEYSLQANSKDYKQTLAYAEDLQNASCRAEGNKSPSKGNPRSGYFPRSPSFSNTTATTTTRGVAEVGSAQSPEEFALLKYAMLREGLLTKLHDLIKAATPSQSLLQPRAQPKEPAFDVSKGTEVLHLLLQLRDTGVMVMESILRWHELRVRLAPMVPLAPFRFENHNYCVKMVSDLDFLSTIKTLGTVLGINPATMKQNPFMMPSPITQRDFRRLCEQPWHSLRLFTNKNDPVQRVAEAEKYLVWCNSNLQDSFTSPVPKSTSPNRYTHGKGSPTASSLKKREQQQRFTWQKRAEKQLEMLSMPLESPLGSTHVMDSSRIMKRKGVLPSLPKSPPKTLTELMENVHCSGGEDDYGDNNNHIRCLRMRWSGEEFSASAADFETLGAHNSPPHHMVTLVSASVLILLSPSDRLPKDLSWRSCQKMLLYGGRLIERVQAFDVASVPVFKWKALIPFLQNEHFQPSFLAQFSNAASTLCAWVYSVLRAAQQQDCERLGLHASGGPGGGGDEDRLVLLSELEVDAAASPKATKIYPSLWSEDEAMLPPLSRSKSSKRVSIGSAEILFINENQPVTSSPRGLSRSSSQRGESPGTTSSQNNFTVSLRSSGGSNALLRTSPWTYRGVVYFVSFFLHEDKNSQQEQEEEFPRLMQRRLLIKIYEPMSSVESHMDVDTEDLRQDFGEQALAAFNSGEYRTLCDLMLGQLDRMMGANEQRASPLTPPQPAKKAAQAKKHPKAVKPNGVRSKSTAERDNELNLLQQDSESNHHDVEQPELLQSDEEAPLSTQDQDHGRRAVVSSEASVLKIQCAARQRQARQKVNRVRDEKLQIIAADNAITADIDPPSRPETVMSYMSEQFEDDHDQQNEAR